MPPEMTSKSKKGTAEAAEVAPLPPVRLGPDCKPVFDNEATALSNAQDPVVSSLARFQAWKHARMTQRMHWQSDAPTATRVYVSAPGSAQSANATGGPPPNAAMQGHFQVLVLRVDLVYGAILGEGCHSTVGDFTLRGHTVASFYNDVHVELALEWANPRYQSLSLELIAPENWVSLKGTASTAAKVTAPKAASGASSSLLLGAKNKISDDKNVGSDSSSSPSIGGSGSSSSGGERAHFILAAGQTEAATREEQVRLRAWADGLRSQRGIPNDDHHHNLQTVAASPPPGSGVGTTGSSYASPNATKSQPPLEKAKVKGGVGGGGPFGDEAPTSAPFFPPIPQAPGPSSRESISKITSKNEKKDKKAKSIDDAKAGDAASSSDDDSDEEESGGGPPGKPKVERLAMRKGTMNYMTRHAFSLRSQYGAGWLNRDADPWLVPRKGAWTCILCPEGSTPVDPTLKFCATCNRDQEGFDAKGFDTEGYDVDGFNASGSQRPLAQRLARERAKKQGSRAQSAATNNRRNDDDGGVNAMLQFSSSGSNSSSGRRSATLSCARCSYVGASPACPFCNQPTESAPMPARLLFLTNRFLLGANERAAALHGAGKDWSQLAWASAADVRQAMRDKAAKNWVPESTSSSSSLQPPPLLKAEERLKSSSNTTSSSSSSILSGSSPSSNVDHAVLKPWQQPGYYRPVPGMLRGSGNYRGNGCRSFVLCFGGRDVKRRVLSSAELLAPDASSWQAVAPLQKVRAQAAAAAVGSRVYAIGGVDSLGARLATVECFEVQSAKWTYAPPLLQARSGAAAAVLPNGTVLVCGGRGLVAGSYEGDEGPLSLCEMLPPTVTGSPTPSIWQAMPPMQVARDRAAAVTCRRRGVHQLEPWQSTSEADTVVVVVFGGVGDSGACLRSVEVYDSVAQTWRRGADMPESRYGAAAASHGGLVYLMGGLIEGGFAAPDAALVYDVRHDIWLSDASNSHYDNSSSSTISNSRNSSRNTSRSGHRRQVQDREESGEASRRAIGLWSPVDHVSKQFRKEDDKYFGARDGGALVTIEGNRMAVIGGIDPTGECFGTVDVLTPLAPQAVAVAQLHAAGASQALASSTRIGDKGRGSEVVPKVVPKVGPIGVELVTHEVRRPEDQGVGLSSDAASKLPLTFSLQPRKHDIHDIKVVGHIAALPRSTVDDEDDDDHDDDHDDDDDEGLWPGQLPPLPSPKQDSNSRSSTEIGSTPSSDAGVYLPFCPNGLPALRVRRAWFGCAVLERYKPEIAMLTAAMGGETWARNVEMLD